MFLFVQYGDGLVMGVASEKMNEKGVLHICPPLNISFLIDNQVIVRKRAKKILNDAKMEGIWLYPIKIK